MCFLFLTLFCLPILAQTIDENCTDVFTSHVFRHVAGNKSELSKSDLEALVNLIKCTVEYHEHEHEHSHIDVVNKGRTGDEAVHSNCSSHHATQCHHGFHSFECLSASVIMKLFNLTTYITKEEFPFICPSLISYIIESKGTSAPITDEKPSKLPLGKIYGYGILATFIVCLASVFGVILFPFLPSAYYHGLTSFLSSLAVGTLSGDALLHLIPHAYGLHSHDTAPCHHHHVDNHADVNEKLYKTLVVISGIYVFYLIDVFLSKLPGGQDASHHHHHKNGVSLESENVDNSSIPKKSLPNYDEFAVSIDSEMAETTFNELLPDIPKAPKSKESMKICFFNFFKSIKEVKRYAWVVLIADAIHNVSDGVTIGAAFGVRMELGITTTLAVLLHELPHELGDYAILISSGFTHLQALFFNFLTALTAFFGLLLGISLSNQETTQQWTLAAAAGIFLYVSLVDLFPLLLPSKSTSTSIVLLHNAGLLLGFAVMFLLAAYEDQIKFSI